MSKRYCGLIKPNLEDPYQPFRTVSVEIRDESGCVVKKYDLEPANQHLGIPFFNDYAWGYAGEGPKALAEAILFDYTQDAGKIRKYRNALISEIQKLDSDADFILESNHIEAAIRLADR